MYMVTRSFYVADIMAAEFPLIYYLPGIFIGFLMVLTIKLRKSPFDISTSHHAHQEIVKGVTTEFSGPMFGLVELAHWYENVFLLGFIYLFFAWNPAIAIGALAIVYFAEIVIDNTFSRVTWQLTLKSSWIIAGFMGIANLGILYYLSAVVPL